MIRFAAVFTLLLLFQPQASSAIDFFEGKSSESMISEYDGNGDGRLTFEELMSSLEKTARKWFNAMDRNKDGAVSGGDGEALQEEIERSFDWLWDMLDGLLDEDEGPGELKT